jgi:membrane associated rhomboid family serine protease
MPRDRGIGHGGGRQHSSERRLPRRWPVATASVLAVTAVLTVLQYSFPQVRLALWRDPDMIAAGQWWRLVTALFVQYDAVWQILVVFACIGAVGVLAERIFGHGWWLVLYFGCGVIGQVFGYLWEPPDSGASVAGAGLLGAVCAWLLSPAGPRQIQVRVWGVVWPLVGVALTLKKDQHGPPLLVGFAVSRPAQSRRDRGTTALILGFFGFVLRRVIGRVRRSLRAGAGGGMVLP